MRSRFANLFLTAMLTLTFASLAPTIAVTQQPLPPTWQEMQKFRSGPTPFEPLMKFWYDLDQMSDLVSIRELTRTLLDREFTLVTIARDPVASPQDAIRSGKTIVLIANAVHGNETAGKEASQLVARELVSGKLQHLLDDVIVLFVPLINPDGGEVRRRTNEEGFDMNRDYIKLESQEIYALVTRVMNEWTPDIHIDTHHGGSAPYTLTWQGTLNPAADAELRAYPYAHIFPRMRDALRAEGYDGFDYSGAQTRQGTRGWGSTSVEPRKHHVYTGLVNSIGILFETPSSSHRVRDGKVEAIPQEERYYHQVRGQVVGMTAVLQHAAERRAEIRALTNASARPRTTPWSSITSWCHAARSRSGCRREMAATRRSRFRTSRCGSSTTSHVQCLARGDTSSQPRSRRSCRCCWITASRCIASPRRRQWNSRCTTRLPYSGTSTSRGTT
jgi:hypothetical protein